MLLYGVPTVVWNGVNRIPLTWPSIGALGSGDIRVEMTYQSGAFDVDPLVSDDGNNTQTYPGQHINSQTITITRTFSAEEAASGAMMEWEGPGIASVGGIATVLSIAVSKKDVGGNWVEVIRQLTGGEVDNVVTINAPANHDTDMLLQVRRLGSTSDADWSALSERDFGDQLYYSTANPRLASDVYEYRVQTKRVGEASYTTSSTGVIDLRPPKLGTIDAPVSQGANGKYTWASPGASVSQTFRVRLAGTSGVWRTLPVSPRGVDANGVSIDGINATMLASGTYDYELLYNRAGELRPSMHATGQLNVAAGTGKPPVDGLSVAPRADGTVLVDWFKSTEPLAQTTVQLLDPLGKPWETTMTLVPGNPAHEQIVFGQNMPFGDWTLDVTQAVGTTIVGFTSTRITFIAGTVPQAVVTDSTAPYVAAPGEPTLGLPLVTGFSTQFVSAATGDWT
ncbi:MAG: hypothetical protein H7123_04985, partial [Thermoleophilia bacterium]|nr:hypothetical protein [Thermoleophilia bacterium]